MFDLGNYKFNNFDDFQKKVSNLDSDEKGEIFEIFAYSYFKLFHRKYNVKFIYREKDIPENLKVKYDLENTDYGVDGIILTSDDKCIAYQVKYRSDHNISYRELSTFISESENVDYRCIFTNCENIPKPIRKKNNLFSVMLSDLKNLDDSFFTNLYELNSKKVLTKRKFHKPRQYQEKILNDIQAGFKKNRRGKLISACGTGKTLIALWVTQRLDSKFILFVAPSLALIKQTLDSWVDQSPEDFLYLCVCSDMTVANDQQENDYFDVTMDVPVTTNPQEILKFYKLKTNTKKIIFSTYQSLGAIAHSLNDQNFVFDFAFFDEAHRTAGFKNSDAFTNFAFSDEYIPVEKRLFLTATERVVSRRIKDLAVNNETEIFSMDDENQYGTVFSKYSLGEAIKDGVITDYKIVLSFIEENQFPEYLEKNEVIDISSYDSEEKTAQSNSLLKQIILGKAVNELNLKKIITYHSRIKSAKDFIFGSKDTLPLEDVFNRQFSFSDSDLYLNHINGTFKANSRSKIFNDFDKSKMSILSNSQCLTEGVDIPSIDAVFFSDPKGSKIDIVQAVGRCLRKDKNDSEYSFIIIPVVLPKDASGFEGLDSEIFENMYEVISSLKDQDYRLSDLIDELNLMKAKGVKTRGGNNLPIITLGTESISIEDLDELIETKVSEIHNNTKNVLKDKIIKTSGTRKSNYKRIIKTIGDYSIDSYEKLVIKTIKKFANVNDTKLVSDLRIDNNNLSHTKRLGIITKLKNDEYKLTSIGKELYKDNNLFKSIINEQMIKYVSIYNKDELKVQTPSEDAFARRYTKNYYVISPYRLFLQLLSNFENLDMLDFVFGYYSIKKDEDIHDAISRINFLKNTYPNIQIMNQTNKEKSLHIINCTFGTNFDYKDIWTKKTTTYNQFLYFSDHLESLGICQRVRQPYVKLIKNENILYKNHHIDTDDFIESILQKNTVINQDTVFDGCNILSTYQKYNKLF